MSYVLTVPYVRSYSYYRILNPLKFFLSLFLFLGLIQYLRILIQTYVPKPPFKAKAPENEALTRNQYNYYPGPLHVPPISNLRLQYWHVDPSSVREEQSCPIPKLEPWSKEVVDYFETKRKLEFQGCENRPGFPFPLLFNSTWDGHIIPMKPRSEFDAVGITSCCYRVIGRGNGTGFPPDNYYNFSKTCFAVSLDHDTIISPDHEFIAIFCRMTSEHNLENEKAIDLHAFVPDFEWKRKSKPEMKPKPAINASSSDSDSSDDDDDDEDNDGEDFDEGSYEVEEEDEETKDEKGTKKLNVLILLLDSMSRANFIRMMPRTYGYLKNELQTVDFRGYNKIGENTFLNAVPLLSSRTKSELEFKCGNINLTVDSCPYIWKDYSNSGYATGFAEDSSKSTGAFNRHRLGFLQPPVDYYLRPFSLAASELLPSEEHLCFGPRLAFQVLLDYLKKFFRKMDAERKPFFQLVRANYPFRHGVQGAGLVDDRLLEFLRWLKHSGYLNNTLVALLSEHGNQLDSFRNTLQGQLEDLLPSLFLLVPEWMKRGEYSGAFANLEGNRERLVTPLDVHETIVDLLDFQNKINNTAISKRVSILREKELNRSVTRELSLFLPIPPGRTCKQAHIERVFCSCNNFKLESPSSPVGKTAAEFLIRIINLVVLRNFEDKCAKLELDKVTMLLQGEEAVDRQRQQKRQQEVYITFEARPMGGIFEALMVREWKRKWKGWGQWKIQGPIIRASELGNQSHCVEGDLLRQNFCYCI